jgi:hypothetical protein
MDIFQVGGLATSSRAIIDDLALELFSLFIQHGHCDPSFLRIHSLFSTDVYLLRTGEVFFMSPVHFGHISISHSGKSNCRHLIDSLF